MAPTLFTLSFVASLILQAVATSPAAGIGPHAIHRRHHHNVTKKRHTSDSSSKRNNDGPELRFAYGDEVVRGVNLGGWLVLEPFITPSLFSQTGNDAIVDELTFCKYQDYGTAHKKLVQHWDTWITEADLWAIKAAGLNHVRIPIGYWAYDTSKGEAYHKGADEYLQKAIGWAGKVGLKVWVDLHGAPGSQNGFDNSGERMGYPTWHTKQENVDRTNAIIKTLAARYAQDKYPQVTAIAPLNEPAGYRGNDVLTVTKQYWYDSFGNIRYPFGNDAQSNVLEVIHDTFQPLTSWQYFMPRNNFPGTALDTHIYEVFSQAENERTWEEHIASVCSRGDSIKSFTNNPGSMWTIVGEWSLAAYDCATWLNGRGVGARYQGTYPGSTKIGECAPFTGNGAHFALEYKAFLRKFWEAQVVSFEKGQGWFYWTWKTESADEWSYSAGLKNKWIPLNPDERIYPGICS